MTKNLGGHPTAQRVAEIKTSVVAATLAAFAEKGNGFSMDEVARLAGVSKQAIYRRWRSKTDLVVEAIESMLEAGLDRPPETRDDPVAALEELAWRSFGSDQVVSNRLQVFLQAESFGNARLFAHLVAWRRRFIARYGSALADVERIGRRRPGDIDVQATLLLELLSGGGQTLALTDAYTPAEQRLCFDQRWAAFRAIAIL